MLNEILAIVLSNIVLINPMVAYRYFTISQTDERNETTTRGGGFSEYIGISEPLTFPMAKWRSKKCIRKCNPDPIHT